MVQPIAGTDGPASSRCSSCRTWSSPTASTRASCGATELVAMCARQPDADRLERAGRRAARRARSCERGTCTTTSTPAARCCSAASRRALRRPVGGAPPTRGLRDAVRRQRPGATRRAGSTRTTRRSGRRSPTRSPTCSSARSRSTRRCAATSTSSAATEKIPIHGGPGTLGVFNAINVTLDAGERLPGRAARLELHAGGAVRRAALPDVAHDPDLLAVDEPDARRTSPTRRACSRASEWNPMRFCERRVAPRPAPAGPARRLIIEPAGGHQACGPPDHRRRHRGGLGGARAACGGGRGAARRARARSALPPAADHQGLPGGRRDARTTP